MPEPLLFFVYGTLRRASEHPMARRLREAADWYAQASWKGALFDMGSHPAAVTSEVAGDRVQGDVFRVHDERIIAVLDEYEDCGPGGTLGPLGFVREEHEVVSTAGDALHAWMYRFTRSVTGGRRIPHGDYLRDRALRGED